MSLLPRFSLHASFAFGIGALASLALGSEARADDNSTAASSAPTEEADSPAMSANRGFSLGLGPTLLLPMRRGGPYGGGLSIDARYGIKTGPLVLAPGALLSGYAISGRLIGVPLGTFRITVPIGPFAPFVVGGVGYGWISNPAESGMAFLGGGGMVVHVGRVFALGIEATYQTITTTEFHSVALGPVLIFGG